MKILVIGGGFAGCASAEILSHFKNCKIKLVEKSSELGAGVRTYFYGGHPYTFGPRHFISTRKEAFIYLKKFLKMRNCNYHQFKSYVETDDKFYNYPINKKDINVMPDKKKIVKELKNKNKKIHAKNLEEFWIKSVGHTLFNKIIKNYNKKMWMVDSCKKLDTFNWSPKGYTIKSGTRAAFDDHISAYPTHKDGYNRFFDKIKKIKNVSLKMNSEIKKLNMKSRTYFLNGKKYNFDILINTISPDILFNYKFGELKYIGRDLMKIVFPVKEVFPKDVFFLYYPNLENFTRLVEYKKFTLHKSNTSLVGVEIPSKNGKYYPLPIKSEQKVAKKYFEKFEKNCFSIGRAGSYRYEVDIDDCIYQALEIKKIIENDSWDGPVIGKEFKIN
jgi:UDP-galactopyranose mutase